VAKHDVNRDDVLAAIVETGVNNPEIGYRGWLGRGLAR